MIGHSLVACGRLSAGSASCTSNASRCLASLRDAHRRRMPQKTSIPAPETETDGQEKNDALQKMAQSSPLLTGTAKTINKSMLMFLERAEKQEAFLEREKAEFELGRRHLANMMGLDHHTMTQTDIDEAIAYLFPSGLFEPRARPVMKSPEELFPARKQPQFDNTGRPFHPLFYTLQPNFNQLLHDIHAKYLKLDTFLGMQRAEGGQQQNSPDKEEFSMALGRSQWITLLELQSKLIEYVGEEQYAQFMTIADHLCAHPLAHMEREFLMDFRKQTTSATTKSNFLDTFMSELKMDEQGRQYVEATGKRKHTIVNVRLTALGSGRIMINGKPLSNIRMPTARAQIVAPLLLLNRQQEFDVTATTIWRKQEPDQLKQQEWPYSFYGENALAGAVRFGIAIALRSFVSEKEQKSLDLAGYLTYDARMKERKKPGRVKARKKYTWKRR